MSGKLKGKWERKKKLRMFVYWLRFRREKIIGKERFIDITTKLSVSGKLTEYRF